MSIGILYYSHSTSRGEAEFTQMPFYDASINHNRDKASSMSFKSNVKLDEADRIIYENTNNKKFGGQIVKRSKTLGGDYSYEIIDYTRLYQSKVTCSFSKSSSAIILKSLIKSNKNNLSIAGIENTSYVHAYLKWENKTLWEIIEQLAWLEYKAGNHIYYDIDYTGKLIWKQIPKKDIGYKFTEAYDYEESHDSSDIITQGVFLNSSKPGQKVEVFASKDMIAKWGYVSSIATCTPSSSNKKTTCNTDSKSTSTYYTQCGLSPDQKLIVAIGKPSAPGEGKYPYSLHKAVFKNYCPHCGKATLVWGFQWGSGKVPCKGTYEGGSAEGHVFCKNCDADYGCLTGREHIEGSQFYLKTVSKPVKSSLKEANLLKNGKLPYKKQVTKSKSCKNQNTSSSGKSLKNEANIRKYNIPATVWKTAVEITNPNHSEMQNAKTIFAYMKKHTVYEGYTNTRYGAAGTLKKGKGNCVDHAHLFAAMCRSIGIKCNYIHNSCICHVYNKVYINGKGIIVDTGRGNTGTNTSTWGSHYGGAGCPVEKETLNF